ncbi:MULTISPECIES: trypco2 family protein [Streptomyces]|uniref:Trypco2 family protein n=1 Tax=Streptomyces solicathayae TaxID=3081768 RepID=A0ABZ0LVU5_9ACTN|nr:trypco2 family protein [Streptomyces sp. HUAS YS2]WOX23572.1 trypco2 family protein [Streptomyces sp. HUAS YS2]
MDIELADLLKSLRSEIGRARLDAAGQDVRFRIDSIDLELQVAVEKSAEANAGMKFWVVSLGAKGTAKAAETHTVRLSLAAETATGEPVLTGDDVSDLFSAG